MSFDLITARTVIGLDPTDTSRDIPLQKSLDTVLAFVEKKLGRGLLLETVTESYFDIHTTDLRLRRYPIEQIITINGQPVTENSLLVNHRVGWIRNLHGNSWNNNPIVVNYSGGFDPLPDDLEYALWEIFQTYWASVDQTTGLPAAGGGTAGTVIPGSGDVSSVSFGPFGTVRYDVGATVVGDESSASINAKQWKVWGWLAPWAYILETYRSDIAPSVAFA
jgi:hypothetical protein